MLNSKVDGHKKGPERGRAVFSSGTGLFARPAFSGFATFIGTATIIRLIRRRRSVITRVRGTPTAADGETHKRSQAQDRE